MTATNSTPFKHCSKCDQDKPATTEYFPRHKGMKDGLGHWCKQCSKEAMNKHRRKKGVKPQLGAVEGDQRRCSKCAKWYPNTEEYFYMRSDGIAISWCKNCYKARLQTPRVRKLADDAIRRHRKRHADRYEARKAVGNAVHTGKLSPANTLICTRCEKQASAYHHWSYKPEHKLDVIPLCLRCHHDLHKMPDEQRQRLETELRLKRSSTL